MRPVKATMMKPGRNARPKIVSGAERDWIVTIPRKARETMLKLTTGEQAVEFTLDFEAAFEAGFIKPVA